MAGFLNNSSRAIASGHSSAEIDPVEAVLRLWAREPAPGRRAVCALSVLAYVEQATGRTLRPSPGLLTPIALAAIWLRPGSFEAFAAWAMEQLGCPPTIAPRRGDVGLVWLPISGLTACLCTASSMWAARARRGVVIQPGSAVAAWRVSCPPR